MTKFRLGAARTIASLAFIAMSLGSVWASPTPPTLAWSHVFSTGTQDDYGNLSVDSTGNTYALRDSIPYGVSTRTLTFHLSKILPTGGVIDSAPFTFQNTGTSSYPIIGKDGFIYVYVQQFSPNSTFIAKYNTSVQKVWSHTFANQAFVGMSVDASGLIHLALMGDTSLELLKMSSAGVPTTPVTTPDISAYNGFYSNGNWTVAGTINDNVHAGAQWGVYRESDAAKLGGASIVNSYNKGTGLYLTNSVEVMPYSGDILVYLDTTSQSDPTSAIGTNQFLLSRYSLGSGGVTRQWVDGPHTGYLESSVRQVQSNNGNLPIYLIATPGNLIIPTNNQDLPSQLYIYDYQGHVTSATTVPYESFSLNPINPNHADQSGFFSFNYDRGTNSTTVQRHELDPTLPADWSLTVTGNSTSSNGYTLSDGTFLNNVFMLSLIDGNGSTGEDYEVRRYVFGPTLSTVTPSKATVKSGTTVTFKVQLTAAAPAGGLAITMVSHDPHLLFSNNTQTLNIAIPYGSIFANVTMHATTVASNTVVSVQGSQNGVVKGGVVTITP
jgi:hypothetical protein